MNLPVIYEELSWQERRSVREEYIRLQKGICVHCKTPLKDKPPTPRWIDWRLFPNGKGFLKYPVHLHHCHDSGYTIGAVHAYCNADLWYNFGE